MFFMWLCYVLFHKCSVILVDDLFSSVYSRNQVFFFFYFQIQYFNDHEQLYFKHLIFMNQQKYFANHFPSYLAVLVCI